MKCYEHAAAIGCVPAAATAAAAAAAAVAVAGGGCPEVQHQESSIAKACA